ncbi:MAG TPA: helix-turn-helix domain-containing protein [Streptosporangiaceae bacterium]|jgi:AcrR family transcriptional regulator|nr:helix-turn-helix domain-containing protein [Streptosporangiaceae bacterium]
MHESSRGRASRRPYHSPTRRRQAEQTRARILTAARDLFRSAGYATTTIDAIASSAQVSAKTVEAAFGSKRGVLAALVDPLASAGPPRDLVDQIRAARDPRRRLRLVAELTRRAYEAALPEFELMRGAAAVAPEITAVARQVESRRRANQTRLTTDLEQRGLLRDDLALDEATDIIWALTSYDLYRALIGERHWPAERYEHWLAETVAASLLRDRHDPSSGV